MAEQGCVLGYSLLGVYPCAVWKPNSSTTPQQRHNCECTSGGPLRTTRLAATSVRAVPYPQSAPHHQSQVAASAASAAAAAPQVPDSTTQQTEPLSNPDSQSQVSTTTTHSDQPIVAIPAEHCHPYFQPQAKITTPNLTFSCNQNSIALPYNTTAALPVVQNPCVIPVEQCYPNGVLTNIPSVSTNTNCLPVGQCYTGVVPANITGTNSTACLPVTQRYQNQVVNNSIAVADCRCQAEGNDCCHASITPYPPTTTAASMLFVPYSLPNFPPQYRGHIAASTSPCSGTTPVKVR